MRNLSRLEKRTCLSSTCYRPSMVSNAFPDQSFSPCHHREIICSYIRTPTAPAVPRRYSFYVECPSLPSTVGFSRTPFFDCRPRRPQIHDTNTRVCSSRVRPLRIPTNFVLAYVIGCGPKCAHSAREHHLSLFNINIRQRWNDSENAVSAFRTAAILRHTRHTRVESERVGYDRRGKSIWLLTVSKRESYIPYLYNAYN